MAYWTTGIVSIDAISIKKEEEKEQIYGIQLELSNGAISPFYEAPKRLDAFLTKEEKDDTSKDYLIDESEFGPGSKRKVCDKLGT